MRPSRPLLAVVALTMLRGAACTSLLMPACGVMTPEGLCTSDEASTASMLQHHALREPSDEELLEEADEPETAEEPIEMKSLDAHPAERPA
eukprot:CAMPEP_0171202616 /NCGR_PEP_ID=MMETSP0790-20130122/25095_1 /TAXON_ID=2925 /ORGANISM="Alexandrium catenella, Strain OF101" /LENGTH=90 /DNA_ID=CAMNT_0011668047 /DNA_START=89 /DNA_END=358 /DNA_ORIENTATION=-